MSHDPARSVRHRRRHAALHRHRPPLALTATLAFVALAVALVLLARPANAESRTITESYDVGSAGELELNLPFGDVRVEGVERGPVRVRVEADCDGHSNCDEYLEKMRLDSKRRGDVLRVSLKGPKGKGIWDFEGSGDERDGDGWKGDRAQGRGQADIDIRITIQVPRSLALDLNIGAGEVEISGLRRDLTVDMGAGELDLRLEERAVRSVEVNVAVGEVQIHQGGRTKEYARLIGGPVRWTEGKGSSAIDVNIGTGEVDVTLE